MSAPETLSPLPDLSYSFQQVAKLGKSTILARKGPDEGGANSEHLLELRAERPSNSGTEYLGISLRDADIPLPDFPETIRLVSIELGGKEVPWNTFYDATARFTDDASDNLEESEWDGTYELSIFPNVSNSHGDDEKYFALQPPFIQHHFIAFELSLDPFHNPAKSPRIVIIAGTDSSQEFELIREEGEVTQVQLRISSDIFKDKERMLDDIQAFFASFNSEIVDESLVPMLEMIQSDPEYAILSD